MKISKNKNWNFFIILFIFAIIIIFLSITYSQFFSSAFKKMNGEKIGIDEEVYGSTVFDTTNIDLVPILDKEVAEREENVIHISFLVGGAKDNTVSNIIYDIALNDLKVDCNLISPYVKWKLIKNGKEISNGSLDYHFYTIENGRLVLTNIQQDLIKYSTDKNTYDKYDFYLWVSDNCQDKDILKCDDLGDQSFLMGKKLYGKVEVELYSSDKKNLVREKHDVLDTSTCQK